MIPGTVADPLGFPSADAAQESHALDLRVEMLAGAGPGSPGYISVPRHSWRYVSWWSAWPLNPEAPAMLEGSPFGLLPLSEARVNWPLGAAEWLRIVNPSPVVVGGVILPESGTYLLTLKLHNAELDARAIRCLPFSQQRSVVVPPGGVATRIISWGRWGTPGASLLIDFATGYAPYRRVRIQMTPPVLPNTAAVKWMSLFVCSSSDAIPASGNLVVDPPATDTADVVFTNNGVPPLPVDVLVWFDSV